MYALRSCAPSACMACACASLLGRWPPSTPSTPSTYATHAGKLLSRMASVARSAALTNSTISCTTSRPSCNGAAGSWSGDDRADDAGPSGLLPAGPPAPAAAVSRAVGESLCSSSRTCMSKGGTMQGCLTVVHVEGDGRLAGVLGPQPIETPPYLRLWVRGRCAWGPALRPLPVSCCQVAQQRAPSSCSSWLFFCVLIQPSTGCGRT
jgi:hypothetical protein